jgi:lactoylglutathione lyase
VSNARHILTILAVADLERSVRFYGAAFDWPARVETPVYVELELPGGRGLGLYAREGFARNTNRMPAEVPSDGIAGTELYFHCDDLSAAVSALEEAGARLLSPRAPRGWGDEAAYFADPDGNVLVVAAPLP